MSDIVDFPLQAYRRGRTFDGTDRGIQIATAGANVLDATGNYALFAFGILIPDLGVGTETIQLYDGGASLVQGGLGVGYANNGGSGKLFCHIGGGAADFFVGVDWTADGAWHDIEIIYTYSTILSAATYEIWIDGVLQGTYNTDGTESPIGAFTANALGILETITSTRLNSAATAVRGTTAFATGDGTNLMPSGAKIDYFRMERQSSGAADVELWLDETDDTLIDQTGDFSPAFIGTGLTIPARIAAEFTITEDVTTLDDLVTHAVGALNLGDQKTLVATNTGDCRGFIVAGEDFSGGSIRAVTEPDWPLLLDEAETQDTVMEVVSDRNLQGRYTWDAFGASGTDTDFEDDGSPFGEFTAKLGALSISVTGGGTLDDPARAAASDAYLLLLED